jgi:hypothetical protein
MTSTKRRLRTQALGAVVLLCLGCVTAPPAALAADHPDLLRVRSTDSAITALIELAATRSPTFKNLVALIQASDGIVYVEPGECGHGTRACLKVWMRASGTTRFLRVVVNRAGRSDVDLMGSIGHELQHSVEALSERGTVDSATLYSFFSRTAFGGDNRFETVEAINVGDAVRHELRDLRGR